MIVGGQTRVCFNYHRLSSTIIDYHAPFEQGFTEGVGKIIKKKVTGSGDCQKATENSKSLQNFCDCHFYVFLMNQRTEGPKIQPAGD